MKTRIGANVTSRNFIIILSLASIIALSLSLAQEMAMPVQSGAISTVDWNAASDMQVLLQAVEMLPTVSAESIPPFGTFYSAQHAPGSAEQWPPLPSNVRQVPLWNLGDGVYLMADQQVDYSLPPMSSRMAGSVMTMNIPAFDGGGDGTNSDAPLFNFMPDYGTNLWIAQVDVASNYFSGIVSNSFADIQYEIQYTTDLTQTNWQSAN